MSRLSFSLYEATPPSVAVEIAAGHVSAAALAPHRGRPAVSAHATSPLPDGAVVASLTAQNVRDRAAVAAAVGRVLDAVGRPRRVALVVPDPVVKVSLIRFEHVPPRRQELDQLVRWQVRKTAPFPIEEAQVTWVEGIKTPEGQEFLVSLARRDVILEYEQLCTAAGAHAGLVDISTFNVVNAVLHGSVPAVDWLLVHVAADYASIAILRGPHLILFRSRSADAEGTLEDLVHQTAMYYEDRLSGAGFDRVLLSGASRAGARQAAGVELIRRNLQERLGKPVETVAARIGVDVTDRVATAPALIDTLAPLVGVLLRGREVLA
jgi:Tfp pilus assembly PilM family ATPase